MCNSGCFEVEKADSKRRHPRFRNRWFVASLFLLAGLCVSLVFGVYQPFNGGNGNGNSRARTLTFYWLSGMQEIINGTLRLEVTTSWNTENLTLTVTVNDKYLEEWWPKAFVGLVFGSYENGSVRWKHETTIALMSNNRFFEYSLVMFSEDFGDYFGFAAMPSSPSPYHSCAYEEGIGYIYHISLPRAFVGNSTVMVLHYGSPWYRDITLPDWVNVIIEEWR